MLTGQSSKLLLLVHGFAVDFEGAIWLVVVSSILASSDQLDCMA